MKQYRHLLYSLLLLTLSWQAHAQNVFDTKAADSVTLHPRVSNNDTTYYAAPLREKSKMTIGGKYAM